MEDYKWREQDIEAAIANGWFAQLCNTCKPDQWKLNPPTLWAWVGEEHDGISTIHTCECGTAETVAWWSVAELDPMYL